MSELERIERRIMEVERLAREILERQRQMELTLAAILAAVSQPTTYSGQFGRRASDILKDPIMKTLLALLTLLAGLAQAQTVTIPSQTACSTVPAQTVCVTLPARTLPVTAGTTTSPPPPTCTPPQVLVNGVCTTPVTPPAGGAPTVTALPMGWAVNFAPAAGAINYVVTDPNQHWFSSGAGSPHLQSRPPIFVQGVSGASAASSAALQVFAQAANGSWSAITPAAAAVRIGGALPPYTDPYWVYHAGSYNWSCDFSQPGGDAGALLPQFGGTGAPSNPQDADIAWFDTSVPAVSGPPSVRIQHAVTGNFSPCALGTTVNPVGHAYAYWVIAIQPEYANANYSVVYEGLNDAVVSNTVTLAQYVSRPAKGSFTPNQWNFVNVPMAALGVKAGVYKTIIQQVPGQSGVWHVDNLGWANTAQ